MTMQSVQCFHVWLAKRWRAQRCIETIALRFLLFLLFLVGGGTNLQAQFAQNSLPQGQYYTGLQAFDAGKFQTAEKLFLKASSGYKLGTAQGSQLWVDAVCSFTMAGECHYQVGNFDRAIELYRDALDVYLANAGWLQRVTFPATLQRDESAVAQARINWGTTRRTGAIARVKNMQVLFGDPNAQNAIQNGGVFRPTEHRLADVSEILKCAGLAMVRRRELMGPLTRHAPYSRTLGAAAEASLMNQHPYAKAWTELVNGVALAANQEFSKAELNLQSAAQAKGLDHPLTPIALFELANVHAQQGKLKTAQTLYLEATFSAAIFRQWVILSQSFHRGFLVHLLNGNQGEYEPLSLILQGDLFSRLPDAVRCNLLLLGAEANIEVNNGGQSLAFLDKAKRFIDRDTRNSELAARYFFHLAQANALAGNVGDCYANAANAIKIYASSSRRLFQIRKAVQLDLNGMVTQRTAGEIYGELLKEPTGSDWQVSPLEALTLLLSPLQDPRARWFQIAMGRKEYEKGIEIADNIRRFQFYNAMPLGGRLLAFRWMLEAPDTMVGAETQEQKKIFNLAYPEYQALSDRAKKIEEDLAKIKGIPALDSEEGKSQVQLVNQLSENSVLRDAMILNAAMKRNAAPMSFPPRLRFGELQKRLKPKQVAWIFFLNGNQYYSFLLTKDAYKLDRQVPAVAVQRALPAILKKMGNTGVRTGSVSQKILEENGWKKPARELMKALEPKNANWESYDELIVVPDGPLWYLPFEILQVGDDANAVNLVDQVPIRYAPTVSTIVPDERKVKPAGRSLVVAGRLTRNQDREVTTQEVEKLQKSLPEVTVLNQRIPFDSASYSSQIDTLIVWDEIEMSEKMAGLEWAPLQVDKEKPRSNMRAWMNLPFAGPEQYVVPGYHTDAGSGRVRGNGQEIFLAVSAMMASGARTVLISRWAVGGENDYNLTRNFVSELSGNSAVKAWEKARQLTALNEINPEREPRIRSLTGDVALKTDHPFFWSGYLLVDTGVEPLKDGAAEGPPANAEPEDGKDKK
ncbi:MAG: CHAT domain-containing protein [Planctomycetota bacterium]|nr:CHAT domain-containing protein [Planctomycetota bacterium]